MLKVAFTAFVSLTFSPTLLANEAKTNWNLVEICKKDCPKAKNDEEAHKCAEKIGKLNKEFRKSQCWEVNEKYEAAAGKAQE
jgi:hypothetical protein